MSDTTVPVQTESEADTTEKSSGGSSFGKLARYTITRLVTLGITVAIGIYLTILIANMGGYVDEIRKGAIREQVSIAIFQDQSAEMRALSSEDKNKLIEDRVALEEKRLGLVEDCAPDHPGAAATHPGALGGCQSYIVLPGTFLGAFPLKTVWQFYG